MEVARRKQNTKKHVYIITYIYIIADESVSGDLNVGKAKI